MYNPSFIGFLQHMPNQSLLLLYPALSRLSSVSRSAMHHLRTGNVHKISIFKPSEFQMWVLPLCLQNSSLKNLPLPSEFLFKEPPLALGIPRSLSWCMDIFWNCPIKDVHMDMFLQGGLCDCQLGLQPPRGRRVLGYDLGGYVLLGFPNFDPISKRICTPHFNSLLFWKVSFRINIWLTYTTRYDDAASTQVSNLITSISNWR